MTTPPFRSLLYREPGLYDLVFPFDASSARMITAAIERWLPGAPPRSLLDVGCGSGQLLQSLARSIPECHGVDLLESNIAHARSTRPGISFLVGDMRAVRLGRTFDVVTCLGNALSYALSAEALTETMATFAAHAHPGTLLVLDALNAHAYLEGDGFQPRIDGRVDTPGFTATSVSVHSLDRQTRVLERVRTWRIPGQPDVEDYAAYRLLLPDEMKRLLETAGFDLLAMYDNREFRPSDLRGNVAAGPDVGGMRGRKLYVFARRRAS